MKTVFFWHMHQPWYKVGKDGDYVLPWVYLHALKDYSDMAAHFERNPDMRAVVNFSPVLLIQLEDYVNRLEQHLASGIKIGDILLDYLAGVVSVPASPAGRAQIVAACLRAHAPTMITPMPAFSKLYETGRRIHKDNTALGYMAEQFFVDLLTWYHLAWVGYAARFDPVYSRLAQKDGNFTGDDRHDLIKFIYHELKNIIPRYKALIDNGQIELSITPWGHPIAPLLKEFENIRCTQPHDPLPTAHYPDGLERVRWHIEKSINTAEKFFGVRPISVWMGEGAISAKSLTLLANYGFMATASGEAVWRNSCRIDGCPEEEIANKRALFRPYHFNGGDINIFFRDDGLSDMIGFEYSSQNAETAVADFTSHLENIREFLGDEADDCVVSIILDGENAWEYYPENGWEFLEKLYRELSSHQTIKPKTFADCLNLNSKRVIRKICPGSWVYGSFSTWIGDKDKNRAWELLIAARKAYDNYLALHQDIDREKKSGLEQQLAVCEGSDWFWWFGDYNPQENVKLFDRLYRDQLKELYRLLDQIPPDDLNQVISHGCGEAGKLSGTMRSNS